MNDPICSSELLLHSFWSPNQGGFVLQDAELDVLVERQGGVAEEVKGASQEVSTRGGIR